MTTIEMIILLLVVNWFYTLISFFYYVKQKHPKIYISKNFLEVIFSTSDSSKFWREMFKSTQPDDKKYMFKLIQLRITLLLFLTLSLYWTLS